MGEKKFLNGSIVDSDRDILTKYLGISGLIFVLLDRLGNVVSLNQELCDVLGLEVIDIRGKNWFENFVAPKDRKWVKDLFFSLINGKKENLSETVENSIIDKNGNEKVIVWNNALINDKNGEIYGTVSSGINITEKVKIQEEQNLIIEILKLLNNVDNKINLIEEILNYIKSYSGFDSVGIRLKEGDDYPFYHSIGFDEKFISDEKSLCPKNYKDTFLCNTEKCDECICGAVIHGRTSLVDDSYFTEKGTFWSNNITKIEELPNNLVDIIEKPRNRCYREGYRTMALIPIKNGSDIIGLLYLGSKKENMFSNGDIKFYENVVESVGIAIHRIGIEEEMKNANIRIEETNSRLEQFAYKASHDLREPLRTIISYAEILNEDLLNKSSKKQKEYIGKIIDGTELLDKFINDLLSYSRIENTSLKEDVDLNAVCDEVKKHLSSLIKEKKAKIIYNDLPIIKVNEVLIIQLMQNLICNSLKYSKEDEKESIIISVKEDFNNWIVSVHDNGIGIKDEYKNSIFEMFNRITPNKYRGTGMGLAICKKIVETHGGEIWVDSKFGEGSIFNFTIKK